MAIYTATLKSVFYRTGYLHTRLQSVTKRYIWQHGGLLPIFGKERVDGWVHMVVQLRLLWEPLRDSD